MIAVKHWWLAALPVDMRCGIDRLSTRVLEASVAGLAPHTAYLFCNRSGTRLRVLVWDGLGFWLCARRLERGRFVLPAADADSVELSAEQFAWLAAGVDWQRLSAHPKVLHCVWITSSETVEPHAASSSCHAGPLSCFA